MSLQIANSFNFFKFQLVFIYRHISHMESVTTSGDDHELIKKAVEQRWNPTSCVFTHYFLPLTEHYHH